MLDNKVPVFELSEKYGVRPKDIYNWKKKLFESATEIFNNRTSNNQKTLAEKKIEQLESTLKKREEAISYLLNETIDAKKKLDGNL